MAVLYSRFFFWVRAHSLLELRATESRRLHKGSPSKNFLGYILCRGIIKVHSNWFADVRGGSCVEEHGNPPNFSTEFGNIEYILADFGKQDYRQTRKIYVFKDRIRQSFIPTDIDIF